MTEGITPPPLPGDVCGEYRLEQLLGVGGMATVYRASSQTQGWVAIKVLHPGKADTEEERRFRREFLTLRGLLHPHIVQVYEAGRYGDYPWIAMELVEGTDLGTQVERWNASAPDDRFVRVVRIFRQLCEALGYCHEKGLIHRDLKPSNVLVTRQGDAKLTDFGVVKAPGGVFTTQLTVTGKLVGTVAFMAPEQITGETVDARADLYSLGAVLYVMLTGTRPIQADSIAGYLARHLTENPKPPSEHDPRIPPRLERICLKLLAKEPSQRFGSIAEVLSEMDRDDTQLRRALHGRDQQLSQLLGRMETLADGAGGVVILTGPQGVGKSALLEELSIRSGAAGCRVGRIGGMNPEPLAELREQLPHIEGPARVDQLLELALSKGPWTLLVDDLEALPMDDLERITRWVRSLVAISGEPLLVIACTRQVQGLVGPFCSGAATGLTPDIIRLEGLEKRSVVNLMRDMGVTGVAAAILGNRLSEELDGVPGVLLEQLEALVEAEWLSPQPDGSLKSRRSMDSLRADPLPLPLSVQQREAQRLSGLSVEARRVYDTMAVLAMEIGPGLLAEVAGLPMLDCTRALNELEGRSLVRQWIDGVQEVVALLSPRQRDVVYSLMNTDSRAALHLRAAAALRRRFRRRLGAMSEVIANHLTAGGAIAEAYPLLLDSAQRRFRGGRSTEARQLLIQAKNIRTMAEVELDEEQARKLRWKLFVLDGQLLEHSGDLTGAARAWEDALAAAEVHGDFNAVAQSRAGLGLVYAARGEAGMAVDGLTQAISQLPQGDPLWPRVAQALATARLEMGDGNGSESLWTQLESLGRETQNSSILAEAILGRGMVAMLRGQLDEGRAALEDAELRLRDQVRPLQLSRVLLALSELGLAQGRLLGSVERSLEAERVAREIPRVVYCIHALGVAAQARATLGRSAEALAVARESATLARARGRVNTVPELLAAASVARALCACGEPKDGLVLLPPPTGRNVAGIQDPVRVVWAVRARALSLTQPEEANEAVKEVLSRAPSRLPWVAIREQLDVAIALVQTGSSSAPREVARAREGAVHYGFTMCELEAIELQLRLEPIQALESRAETLRSKLSSRLGEPESFIRRWT